MIAFYNCAIWSGLQQDTESRGAAWQLSLHSARVGEGQQKDNFPCRNQCSITYLMLKVEFCRESFIKNPQLRKIRFSFVHLDCFPKFTDPHTEHVCQWRWCMEAWGRDWKKQMSFSHYDVCPLYSWMFSKVSVSGVSKSHSYPFYHLDSPIREDPCPHYMYSNDTNTCSRQRHFWLVRI